MFFIDTHCHLYLEEFAADIGDVMQRAENEGVKKFYLPAIDSSTQEAMLALENQFPGKCIAMMGLHPCSVKSNYREELMLVENSLAGRPFAAIGEIGLDFYWDRTFEKQQYEVLNTQIDWALQYDIPIVIHSRESMQQIIGVVQSRQKGNLRGIFHCFNDSDASAKSIIDLGFYLGIGGVITYKNSRLPDIVRSIDMEYMVLETDSPYLTPVPYRGKRNESSYLRLIAAKLAEVKGLPVEEIARITTANAEKIFGS